MNQLQRKSGVKVRAYRKKEQKVKSRKAGRKRKRKQECNKTKEESNNGDRVP